MTQFCAEDSKLAYFKSFWNWVDIINLVFTPTIIIFAPFVQDDYHLQLLRVIAAVNSCSFFVKTFDWLRLFEDTAFYILLTAETFIDIVAFTVILLTAFMMFGMPLYILGINMNKDGENGMVDGYFGFWPIDVMLNQYLLSLGEFSTDPYEDHYVSRFCWVIFLMATFVT